MRQLLDFGAVMASWRTLPDTDALRDWCDALPVREPVVISVGLGSEPRPVPCVTVGFVARSHAFEEGWGGATDAGPLSDDGFAADRDPVAVAERLASRIHKLEPGESVDVWVGRAAEISPAVLALAFGAAAFLARGRLGAGHYDLEIAVSQPGIHDDPAPERGGSGG